MAIVNRVFRWSLAAAGSIIMNFSAPVLAQTAQSPAQAAALAVKSGLLGTWALVRYEDVSASGEMVKYFGEHPAGYFVYDSTGHVSIQISPDPAILRIQLTDKTKNRPDAGLTPDAANFGSRPDAQVTPYAAYFGTYRLDLAKGTITHVVEGSLRSDYLNTEQERPFTLVGDVLTIGTTMPDGRRYVRELRRVK